RICLRPFGVRNAGRSHAGCAAGARLVQPTLARDCLVVPANRTGRPARRRGAHRPLSSDAAGAVDGVEQRDHALRGRATPPAGRRQTSSTHARRRNLFAAVGAQPHRRLSRRGQRQRLLHFVFRHRSRDHAFLRLAHRMVLLPRLTWTISSTTGPCRCAKERSSCAFSTLWRTRSGTATTSSKPLSTFPASASPKEPFTRCFRGCASRD